MRPETFPANVLRSFLAEHWIATLPEIKIALRTGSTMTVFRKLKSLDYLSSYSHRGRYYTLRGIPRFNQSGVWSFAPAHFSKYGNLQETAIALAGGSEAGFTALELERPLQVETKHALLASVRSGRLRRERLGGAWVYFSRQRSTYIRQRRNRETLEMEVPALSMAVAPGFPEVRTGLMTFFGLLDERQRRLFAGLQSAQMGRGGDQRVATLLGLDVHTVAKGRGEVLSGQSVGARLRRKGGGRHRIEKKHPPS